MWDVLLDGELAARCMLGLTLGSVEGDQMHAKIRVKIGPIPLTYSGTARLVEKDKATGVCCEWKHHGKKQGEPARHPP